MNRDQNKNKKNAKKVTTPWLHLIHNNEGKVRKAESEKGGKREREREREREKERERWGEWGSKWVMSKKKLKWSCWKFNGNGQSQT